MTEKQFEECCRRIQEGDKDGLRDIYEAYISYIYAVVFRVLGNKENAEDVSTDFFIKLWDLIDRYRPGNGHKTWITTIARNMAIDYLRAHKRETTMEEMPDVADAEDIAGASGKNHGKVESEVEETIVGQLSMQDILSQLKENEKQIINMKILGDLTFQEIADILEVPLGTITWRYQNAIKKLRRYGYEQGL